MADQGNVNVTPASRTKQHKTTVPVDAHSSKVQVVPNTNSETSVVEKEHWAYSDEGIRNFSSHVGRRKNTSNFQLDKSDSCESRYKKIDAELIGNCDPGREYFKGRCEALVTNNLILQRSNNKNFNGFRKLIEINNDTSSVYAFKIYLHEFLASNFTAFPNMGLIMPQSSTSVEINVHKTLFCHTKVKLQNAIEIKTFPVYFKENEPQELNRCYQKLLSECPGLIRTQAVNRVILLNRKNRNSMFDFVNSVEDENERRRQRLESELHSSERAGHHNFKVSAKDMLKDIKEYQMITNSSLKETSVEINLFKKLLCLLFILCVVLIMASVAIPEVVQRQESPTVDPIPGWISYYYEKKPEKTRLWIHQTNRKSW